MFSSLAPLYGWIFVGFLLGRLPRLNSRWVARSVIYFFAPIVVFSGVARQPLNGSRLLLPCIFLILCSLVATLAYRVAQKWPAVNAGLVAYTGASGNTGYFGFPLVIALYGADWLGIAILISLGFMIFENTLGFYLMARAKYSVRASLQKLVRLPAIYAFSAGVAANYSGLELSEFYLNNVYAPARLAYSTLGMLIIGLGLSGIRKLQIPRLEATLAFTAKFGVWPAVVLGTLTIAPRLGLHFSDGEQKIMLLLSLVPFPANSVAFSLELRTEPEKAALLVLLSTLFALIYIPSALAVLSH